MIDMGYGVKLGPVMEKVLPTLYNWRNDPRLYANFRQYRPITMEEHIEWYRGLQRNPSVRMFVVGIDDEMRGVCGLTSIDRINSRAELSCYLDPDHDTKEADCLRTLIKYAFTRENLHTVYAEVFDTNTRKLEILKEIGHDVCVNTVTIPYRYFRDGKYISSHMFTYWRD